MKNSWNLAHRYNLSRIKNTLNLKNMPKNLTIKWQELMSLLINHWEIVKVIMKEWSNSEIRLQDLKVKLMISKIHYKAKEINMKERSKSLIESLVRIISVWKNLKEILLIPKVLELKPKQISKTMHQELKNSFKKYTKSWMNLKLNLKNYPISIKDILKITKVMKIYSEFKSNHSDKQSQSLRKNYQHNKPVTLNKWTNFQITWTKNSKNSKQPKKKQSKTSKKDSNNNYKP